MVHVLSSVYSGEEPDRVRSSAREDIVELPPVRTPRRWFHVLSRQRALRRDPEMAALQSRTPVT